MPVRIKIIGTGGIYTGGGVQGPDGQPPDISPDPAIVLQGATQQFTDIHHNIGTWSVAGTDSSGAPTTAAGSINSSTGLYTAPSSVTNQQTAGGMQLLPNNHILNTRIDSLSVHADSATWIAATGGASSTSLSYLSFAPPNYVDGSTPIENMIFYYTTSNNGPFQIPAYPDFQLESGWFDARFYHQFDKDHHSAVIDTTTGMFQEMYQYYPAGDATWLGCPTCTSQSGIRYLNSSYTLASPTTDAAGLPLWPLVLRLQEMEQAIATAGTIKHALRFTLNQFYCASSFIWPATTFATDGGTVPFGARARLKASYDISAFSATSQIILTQLKQYGIIMADGGTGWQVSTEGVRWPKAIADAFQSIEFSAIKASDFEFVDESSLMISADSGKTPLNREIVTFTRTSDSVTDSVDITLQGVAVTLPNDVLHFMAGAAATQLTAFTNTGSVTWAMSPTVGTLTSGGLYTAPGTATTPTNTTVTATSTVDGSVKATLTLTVFADTTVRLLVSQTSPYTDVGANVWYAGGPDKSGMNAYYSFGSESAYGYDNGGSWSGTDIQIYKIPSYHFGDMRFDFIVPNGTYTVTGKFANNQGSDQGDMRFEVNGTAGALFDVFDLVGANAAYDVTVSGVVVSNGSLSTILRAGNTQGNGFAPYISAIFIDKTA